MKSKFHGKIMLKDASGFAENQEKAFYGLGSTNTNKKKRRCPFEQHCGNRRC